MLVPNFVPEPIRVDQNVDEAPWRVQIQFFRDVALLQSACWLVVLVAACVPVPIGPLKAGVILGIFVAVLAVSRRAPVQSQWLISLPMLIFLGIYLRSAHLWSPFLAVFCGVGYVFLAGRDYSRIGQFLLSLIASATAVATICLFTRTSPGESQKQMALVVITLLYGVTDLTSITFRRKPSEAHEAALDLFRDVFNGLTWIVRTVEHMRVHKILGMKKS